MRNYIGIFLLSAATLALEVALTRVFSLTQWYHFAFMAVAVALLGFAASGSFLAVLAPGNGQRRATVASAGFAVAALAVHPLINLVPFDAYRLAIDPLQIVYLVLYILSLSAPFFFSGLALAALLGALPTRSGAIYGANLLGSGAGCLLVLVALPFAGARGMTLFVASLGMLALVAFVWQSSRQLLTAVTALLAGLVLLLALRPPALFDVRLSPYKALSIVSAFQGSRHILSQWNAFSRVDVVEGPAIRSAPGLSLAFKGETPAQPGLTIDGDNLHTIPLTPPGAASSAYADYLPAAVPFHLRPHARALVLQAGAGLDVLVAWRQGAQSVVAVEANPLVVQVARRMGASVYDGRTRVVTDSGPSFLARSGDLYDVIIVSLAESFRAVTSGDFSLSENYIYTVETVEALYRHLAPDGLLAITRWAQWPPSEDLRAAALVAAALRRAGVAAPASQVVAFRSFQTVTIMVRRGAFTAGEIQSLRQSWETLNYDAVYYPGMSPNESSRFIVLPDSRQHDAYVALLNAAPVPDQPFDISPPSNDHPFFFHLFRWRQMGTILRNLGKVWQPFGGAGYLVLVVLLAITIVISAIFIMLPLLFRHELGQQQSITRWQRVLWLAYFIVLGLGFLLIEIPLLQRYILFLGQPVYATAIVLFSLLVSSGLGSLFSQRLMRWQVRLLGLLPLVVMLYAGVTGELLPAAMGLSFVPRLIIAGVALSPLGFLLGLPFPWGLSRLGAVQPHFVPWAWAANGGASVVSSVLAAMLAVSSGFSSVLACGAVAYLLAALIFYDLASSRSAVLYCRQRRRLP